MSDLHRDMINKMVDHVKKSLNSDEESREEHKGSNDTRRNEPTIKGKYEIPPDVPLLKTTQTKR